MLGSVTIGVGGPAGANVEGRLLFVRARVGAQVGASTTFTLTGGGWETIPNAGGSVGAGVQVGPTTIGGEGSCTVGSGCSATGTVGPATTGPGGIGFSVSLGPVTIGAEVNPVHTAKFLGYGALNVIETAWRYVDGQFAAFANPTPADMSRLSQPVYDPLRDK